MDTMNTGWQGEPRPSDAPPYGGPTTVAVAPRRVGVIVSLGIGALLGVALLGFTGLKVKQALAKRDQVAKERVEVQVQAAKKPPALASYPVATTWRPRVEMTGTLKPWREAELGFETSGRIARLLVATGDTVKAGQILVVLDGQRAGDVVGIKEASVRAAAANLALAEDQAKRSEALAKSNSIPDAQAEQARQQAALAKAQMQAAQGDLQLARTGAGLNVIVAPFGGIVTRAPSAAGGVVQPGAPILRIEDLSRFRLSATVSEEDVSLVRVNSPVSVTYRDKTVAGRVSAVVPSLDPGTRRAPVEVEVPNDGAGLLGYGFVRAAIVGDKELPAVRIPGTARRPGSQDEIVRVVSGQAKILRVVHSVGDDGSWIVRGGLSERDLILTAPGSDIRDGDPIPDVDVK